jgi:hypothetical protein
VRYKVGRSNKDQNLHLLCGEGAEAFSALPAAIRHLGPCTVGAEGDVNRLRLPFRSMLAEQGFAVRSVGCRPAERQLAGETCRRRPRGCHSGHRAHLGNQSAAAALHVLGAGHAEGDEAVWEHNPERTSEHTKLQTLTIARG